MANSTLASADPALHTLLPADNRSSAAYDFEPNYLHLDSYRMHFVDEGSGDPILMIHGNPTWSYYYRNLIRRFRPNYRTIAVDHMGCGRSDKPRTYDYCLETHRNNLVELIRRLDLKRTTLVAHDWGGAIGLAALLEEPDRFKRIVLFNTGAFPPPYIPLRIRACRIPFLGKLGVQGLNLFAKSAIKMATEQPGGLPLEIAEQLLAPYDNWDNRTAIYQFVKDIPASAGHRSYQLLKDIESRLSELANLPILLTWGMRDWCFRPECLERFKKHWPAAEVNEIHDAGHYVVEDAVDEVGETVASFLNRHSV